MDLTRYEMTIDKIEESLHVVCTRCGYSNGRSPSVDNLQEALKWAADHESACASDQALVLT